MATIRRHLHAPSLTRRNPPATPPPHRVKLARSPETSSATSLWSTFSMPVHAFIFPGQGSQSVGMGRDLAAAFAAAREVFQEVDETLKQKLSKLMFEGPVEELILTENTQPALMAHSLAVLRVLEREGGTTLQRKAIVAAGHSLGEYSALCAVGAFTVSGAARLLKLRGQSMQKAVPAGVGAMGALLGA